MIDWQVLQGIGGIATAIAVIVALAFGIRQLRDNERQRRDAAAFALIDNWSDPEALRALDAVYALRDAADPQSVEAANASGAVSAVYLRMELLGIMVHGRILSLALANDWAGGGVRVAWRKLRPWIEAKREQTASERPGEWFQWLAERFAEHPGRDEKVGAHTAHRAWRP